MVIDTHSKFNDICVRSDIISVHIQLCEVSTVFSLKGKRALVTGGAAGIGLAVGEAFIRQGAEVVLADIVDGTEAAHGIGAHFVAMDVSRENTIKSGINEASSIVGGQFDTIVLNAGVGDVGPTISETDASLVAKVTDINQQGVLYGLKHAPAHMSDGGSIVCTASMAAYITVPGSGVYSASKRAVTSLVETAALELGPRGIRVNAICPGYTATAMGSGEEGEKMCAAFTALGRVAHTDDLVGAYVFLAADAGRYITGQALQVDGGWSCGPTSALLELVTGNAVAPS